MKLTNGKIFRGKKLHWQYTHGKYFHHGHSKHILTYDKAIALHFMTEVNSVIA